MSVRFFYVDESFDDKKFCLSALSIRHSVWKECFEMIRAHRSNLKRQHGIFMNKEVHARDFVSGRGRIGDKVISKFHRSQIFLGMLELVSKLPDVQVFNVCLENKNHKNVQMDAWDRLVNRVERTMKEFDEREARTRDKTLKAIQPRVTAREMKYLERCMKTYRARAFIISDEGKEQEITKALRKMRVFNPIPSQFEAWPGGEKTKNITATRIVEDPTFKSSSRSYFIQLVDCIAFSLLKREVDPTPNVKKYKIHEMFETALKDVCFLPASAKDPLGIVRK